MRSSLMDVHCTLSHLAFAISQALEPMIVEVKVEWDNVRYLSVEIGCYGQHVQRIADHLSHGVLQGDYDYRFQVARPIRPELNEWTWVRAYPELQHDDKIVSVRRAATKLPSHEDTTHA